MFCPKCGAQLPDGSQFCGKCGAQLADRPPVQSAPKHGNAVAAQGGAADAVKSRPITAAPAFTMPKSGAGLDVRNIGAALGGVLTIVGFAMPWVNVSSYYTSAANTLSSAYSALTSKATYTFDSSYSLFNMLSFGQGIDAVRNCSDMAYTLAMGIPSLLAIAAAIFLIAAAVMTWTSGGKKANLLRAAGAVALVVAVGSAIWFGIYVMGSSSTMMFTVTGCIMATIGAIVTTVLPNATK